MGQGTSRYLLVVVSSGRVGISPGSTYETRQLLFDKRIINRYGRLERQLKGER